MTDTLSPQTIAVMTGRLVRAYRVMGIKLGHRPGFDGTPGPSSPVTLEEAEQWALDWIENECDRYMAATGLPAPALQAAWVITYEAAQALSNGDHLLAAQLLGIAQRLALRSTNRPRPHNSIIGD